MEKKYWYKWDEKRMTWTNNSWQSWLLFCIVVVLALAGLYFRFLVFSTTIIIVFNLIARLFSEPPLSRVSKKYWFWKKRFSKSFKIAYEPNNWQGWSALSVYMFALGMFFQTLNLFWGILFFAIYFGSYVLFAEPMDNNDVKKRNGWETLKYWFLHK